MYLMLKRVTPHPHTCPVVYGCVWVCLCGYVDVGVCEGMRRWWGQQPATPPPGLQSSCAKVRGITYAVLV